MKVVLFYYWLGGRTLVVREALLPGGFCRCSGVEAVRELPAELRQRFTGRTRNLDDPPVTLAGDFEFPRGRDGDSADFDVVEGTNKV